MAGRCSADEETAAFVQAAAASGGCSRDCYPKLADRDLTGLYHDIELPLVPVLGTWRRSASGRHLSPRGDRGEAPRIRSTSSRHGPRAGRRAVHAGSPKQLGEVLFERLGLPVDRKGKTGYSTDARVLGKIRDLHPIVDVVEQWREQSKLLNTYLEPLPGLVDPADRAAAHVRSARRRQPPGGSRRSGRTSRTSPSGRRWAARSGARSSPAGLHAALGRLLAGGAPDPGPRLRGADADGGVRARRGHPPGDGGRGARQPPAELTPRSGTAPRRSTSGSSTASARSACPSSWASPATRRRLHRHLPGTLPGGERVHRTHDRAGQGDGLRDDAVRPPPADAGASRVELADEASANGWQ